MGRQLQNKDRGRKKIARNQEKISKLFHNKAK